MRAGLLHVMNALSSSKDLLFSHESILNSYRSGGKNVMEATIFSAIAILLYLNGGDLMAYALVAVYFWGKAAEAILKNRIESKFKEIEIDSTQDKRWNFQQFA
jgi:hypothetical protein